MRLKWIATAAIASQFFFCAFGADLDVSSILKRANELETRSRNAQGLPERKECAEALYFLATNAVKTELVSNSARFSILRFTSESFSRYLVAGASSPTELKSLASSSLTSNAISLIEISLSAIQVPRPTNVFLNVFPPAQAGGVTASGMDPKSIKDPKARAEYERRIAENNQKAEELNSRARLGLATDDLIGAIKDIVHRLGAGGQSASVEALVRKSDLPPKIKAEILNE